jgi:hypothetical protein
MPGGFDGHTFVSSTSQKSSFSNIKNKKLKTEVIMKTLRFTLIAVLVAFAAATFANADGFKTKPTKKIVSITLEQAVQVPGLAVAMFQQLNSDFLLKNQHVYIKDVDYNGVTFRITGTYDGWVQFFRTLVRIPSENKWLDID